MTRTNRRTADRQMLDHYRHMELQAAIAGRCAFAVVVCAALTTLLTLF